MTLCEMASAIVRDERTDQFKAYLQQSSNESMTRPGDFTFRAEWHIQAVQHACGVPGHLEYPFPHMVTSTVSLEDAVTRIYNLQQLSAEQLENNKVVARILYATKDDPNPKWIDELP